MILDLHFQISERLESQWCRLKDSDVLYQLLLEEVLFLGELLSEVEASALLKPIEKRLKRLKKFALINQEFIRGNNFNSDGFENHKMIEEEILFLRDLLQQL